MLYWKLTANLRSWNKFELNFTFDIWFLQLAPTRSRSVINAMNFVKNPYKMCEKLYNLVHDLTGQLKDMIAQKVYDPRGSEWVGCMINELFRFVCFSTFSTCHYKYLMENFCGGVNLFFCFCFLPTGWFLICRYPLIIIMWNNKKHKN